MDRSEYVEIIQFRKLLTMEKCRELHEYMHPNEEIDFDFWIDCLTLWRDGKWYVTPEGQSMEGFAIHFRAIAEELVKPIKREGKEIITPEIARKELEEPAWMIGDCIAPHGELYIPKPKPKPKFFGLNIDEEAIDRDLEELGE